MNKARLLVIVLMLLTAALFAQKKESLAVFPFKGGSVSDGEALASSLNRQTALQNAFIRRTVITRSTIAAMNFEQRFQREGMTDPDTIFEMAKQLQDPPSHVIAGYITRLGSINLVLVSIMDVESLQQVAGDYRTYRSIEEIDRIIPEIAQKLAAGVTRNTAGLPGLSVPPFSLINEVNQNDAMVLAQIFACELANGNRYAVLPRTDSVEAVLQEHRRQREGVTNQERIRRMGAGRNAKYVLSGSVERLGSSVNKFAADILDIEDGSWWDGDENVYASFSQAFEIIQKLASYLNGSGEPAAQRRDREERQRQAAENMDSFMKNSGIGFGVRGGWSPTSYDVPEPWSMGGDFISWDDNGYNYSGLLLSAFIELRLGRFFSIQPEIVYLAYSQPVLKYYAQRDFITSDSFGYSTTTSVFNRTDIFFASIQIPVLAKVNLSVGNFIFSPAVGLGFNITTNIFGYSNINSQGQDALDSDWWSIMSGHFDLDNKVTMPLSLILGIEAGLKLGRSGNWVLFADLRYTKDLDDMKIEADSSNKIQAAYQNINGEKPPFEVFNIDPANVSLSRSSYFNISLGVKYFIPFRK